MFYSHEILTSRKHGVATIWLVATLGSRSSLRKVSRRAILDVDVPKACDTIADPGSPMALRLQSSLLYGVSRVFSQQCGYILTDMQSLHDRMRGTTLVMKDLQIDSDVAATNHQLNLPADPTFNFDLDIGLDLSVLEINVGRTGSTSLLSPPSLVSSLSSLLPEHEPTIPPLRLSSISGHQDRFFDLNTEGGAATSSVRKASHLLVTDSEEPGIDPNPLFDIDDNGMIIDRLLDQEGEHLLAGNVERPREEDNTEDFLIIGDDDDIEAPSGIPSPPLVTFDHPVSATPQTTHPDFITTTQPISEEMVTIAEAPQKIAFVKLAQPDKVTELRNQQISDWQNAYIENMAKSRLEKLNKQSSVRAKKNAAFLIFGQGIGDVLINFGSDREIHPLSIFSGDTLIDLLTGTQCAVAGRKRSYSHVDSGTEEADDQVRRYSGPEENVGRGDDQIAFADEDDGILIQDDDVEPEMGRRPASSLKDHPSLMPWNTVGSSHQGSLERSAKPGFSSSARGTGLDIGLSSAFSSHRPRLTSASPLMGRGRSLSRLASLDHRFSNATFNFNSDDYADPYAGLTGELDESFELYGPAATVSTQQAVQSQWLAATLENEAHNFLAFLQEQIMADSRPDAQGNSISFCNLLPPEENSNIVAAQGLLHVLALATKGLIDVQQDEAFGDIALSVRKPDTYGEDSHSLPGEV